MKEKDFQLVEQAVPLSDYQRLRKAVGWYVLNDNATAQGLANSLYSVCVLHQGKVIGCGRVIGDTGIYYYIQDIIVQPEYHGNGIGRMIMDAVMKFLETRASDNAFIGLMAAKGVIGFYTKYGFAERPADRPGMFLVWKRS